ncbi:MAG: glycosyltransferase family 2 protein [Candidatus Symbiothrix sp.]|jgi:dolichol-phosphate mannosyltransferase|nr:glycosyltransferase family 2 protein [Candidatus Symbiothrix sp.]
MTKSLTVIVPCYNEELVLQESYRRLKRVLNTLSNPSEISFIDDGSTDNTGVLLAEIAANDPHVKVIVFSRNFGHQKAVTAGINHCTTDLAVIMDADLQDTPELIPEMLELLETNQAQVVYGVRNTRKGESHFKVWSAKWFYRFLNLFSEVELPVDTGDFRLIDSNIIREFNKMPEQGKYVRGLVSWSGFKQIPFYYEREPRLAGETKYPFSKMMTLATTSMLYFSKKPLMLATTLGFLSVVIALIYGLYAVLGHIFGFTHADSGWTSLVVLIVFFGGVQLFTIGILGAYIGNLFDEIKSRPEYIIAKKINC